MNSRTSFSKEGAVLCPVVEGEGETSKRRKVAEGEAAVGREKAPTEEPE